MVTLTTTAPTTPIALDMSTVQTLVATLDHLVAYARTRGRYACSCGVADGQRHLAYCATYDEASTLNLLDRARTALAAGDQPRPNYHVLVVPEAQTTAVMRHDGIAVRLFNWASYEGEELATTFAELSVARLNER